MDDGRTQFIDLGQGAWAVYRIATQSGSVYLMGLHSVGGRRSVVVRGEAGTEKEHVIVRDTDPQLGSRSLFDVPSSDWPGQRLRVATMETSPIAAVTLVTDAKTVTAVTGTMIVHPAGGRREQTSDDRAPELTYAEKQVRYAEDAASLLRAVQRQGDGLALVLDREPQLTARMQVALAGCLVALEELKVRFGRG